MAWYPKTRRIKAGHYEVYMGEEIVRVWRPARAIGIAWLARPIGHTMCVHGFGEKARAVEWAGEWLKEHA